MIPQFASVNKIMLVIHYRVVDVSVNHQETARHPKNVRDSNAFPFVEKTHVVRMPIVKQEITVRSVHAHLTSSEMAIPDVTQNVPNTMTAHETRLVSNSNVETHAENLIQTFVAKVQTVK